MKKIERYIETDEGEMGWCSHEKEYKPIENFIINKKGEYHYFCNDCMKEMVDKRPPSTFDIKQISNKILENLGYDTNSEMPVHKQFEIRNKKWLEHQNLTKKK